MGKVYNKNNKKRNIFKTTSLALSATLAVASLASCKSNSNVYSNINQEGIYSQIGNYSVTNYELFKNMLWSGASELDTQVNNAIVKSYEDKIADAIDNATSDVKKGLGL